MFEGTPYGGFGWVEVQGKPALILDGEIVTRFEGDSEGGVLVRNPISEARADLEKTPADGWRSVGVDTLSLTDGRLFMFDSAFEGAADPAQISADNGVGVITLGAGRWRVDFATTVDEVDLVRFRRV